MLIRHQAATCRWAIATIDLPHPLWIDAWNAPWTCTRDGSARELDTTDECTDCPRWEPAPLRTLREPAGRLPARQRP